MTGSWGAVVTTLLADAGALFAQANPADPHHEGVAAVLRGERGAIVTSQVVAAEVDYLILTRLGVDAELAFLRDLAEATFLAECLRQEELRVAASLIHRHRDLRLGLADASLVVLARRYRTTRILTTDRRHFRVVEPLQGGHFTILPADG
jgi:uncharacterized protein